MSTADDIERRMREAAERAVSVAAHDLLGRAQRAAPVEEGTLRASGVVEMEEHARGALPGHAIVATVSFNTPYAARQHEEITWKHPRGGKAKYLEDELKAMTPRYERVIGESIRAALEGR